MRARDRLTDVAVALAIGISIFAIGGVFRWTQAIVAVVVAVGLAFLAFSRRISARRSPLIMLLGVSAVWTALQLLPLPAALLRLLIPTSYSLREDGANLLGIEPSHTLTGDPAGTLRELVFILTLLGLAVIGVRIATTERGRYRLLALVTLFCGLSALVVGINELFGIHELYGLYKPEYAEPRMLGPILNTNSLACLMAMGAVSGIGLAAYRAQSAWLRALWLVIVTACAAITAAIISRGAVLALVTGVLVTLGVLIAQRLTGADQTPKRRMGFLTGALPIGVVVACAITLVVISNAGKVERQLEQLSIQEMHEKTSKFAAWKSSLSLVEESPWMGVGRGAFEPNFTRVHPASGAATYSYVENEYLQAVVDWGIPGALLMGLAALWFAYVAVRRWRDGPLTAAALGAVSVVAAQSTVDFGIAFLGLAAPATAIAATLAYVPLRETTNRAAIVGMRAAHAAGLVIGAILLLSPITRSLEEDHALLQQRPLTLAEAREAIDRHPLDYYGYATAAELLDRQHDREAIRVLNHALLLHPTHPDLHRMAARMLVRDGYGSQAAVEYAAALRATNAPAKLLTEILRVFDPTRAAAAIPTDFVRPDLVVTTLIEQNRRDVARLWLLRVLNDRPKDSRSCENLFSLTMADPNNVGTNDLVEKCAGLLDYQSRTALAQVLGRQGKFQEVLVPLADVEQWISRADDKADAWLIRCDAHISLKAFDEAKRCLRELDTSPDFRDPRRNEILTRLERIEELKRQAGASSGSAAAP